MTKKKMEKYAKALDFRNPVRNLYGYHSVVAPDGHVFHCRPLLPSKKDAEQSLEDCFPYAGDFVAILNDVGRDFFDLWFWRNRVRFNWKPSDKAIRRLKDCLDGYTIAGMPATTWCKV